MVLKYLKLLLEKHDCVILPGFGAFIGQYHSATVHPIKNTFIPPSKRIAFNAALTNQDGLLLSTLVSNEKLTEEQARENIQEFINTIKAEIHSAGISFLEGIGQFSLSEEKKLVFRANTETNFLEDSYGLPHLFVKPLDKVVMENTSEKRNVQKPEEKKSSSKKAFLIFPIVLIALGVVSSVLLLNKNKQAVSEASLIKKDTTEEVSAYDMDEANKEITVQPIEEVEAAPFHVIMGVFSNVENAEVVVAQQPGAQILEIGGLYKVSVARFNTIEEAKDSIDEYRSQYGDDLWVLKHGLE